MELNDKQKAFLWALKDVGPLTIKGFSRLYREITGNTNHYRFIFRGVEAGYLLPHTNGLQMWGTSRVGVSVSAPKGAEGMATARAENLYERPSYDGAELRPFTGRHGAMDAYKIKSKLYPIEKGGV